MHMADALLSPAVGGIMWAVSAGTIACCSAQLGKEIEDRKVPLMGVLGAFLFAAQMINFSIPGTGSSGHVTGALLLAILLGPCAALLTTASVLVVQALFFADGGLLALGCNIFNIGVIPAFIAYTFCYRQLIGRRPGKVRFAAVTMISAILGLQLGSLAVVLQTVLSGVSSLTFAAFASLMQPIHLAIGFVEGAATIAVVTFVRKARPEMLQQSGVACAGRRPLAKLLASFAAAALLTATVVSWYASEKPDGLEWSIAGASGKANLETVREGVHGVVAGLQEKSAWFPDYALKKSVSAAAMNRDDDPEGGEVKAGTSLAGMVGTLLTLLVAFCLGFLLKKRHQGVSLHR